MDDVAAACRRAYQENEMDVAEHLLQALEVLASREEAEEHSRQVYSRLVRGLRRRSSQ